MLELTLTSIDFNRTPFMRIVIFLCFVISSGCSIFQTEHEHIVLGFNAGEWGWKVGYSAEVPNQYSITEFIREGDDINDWNELLSFQIFPPLWGGPNPEDAFNKLKFIREMKCPAVTKWNIIYKDEKSILYEWQSRPCLGWPDQYEIARIIYGKYNTFVLRYTQKNYQIPDEERLEWIKRFSVAKIETSLK